MEHIRILYVEDEAEDYFLLQEILDKHHPTRYTINRVQSIEECFSIIRTESFDIILLDLGLPDSKGLDGLKRLCHRRCMIPIVVFTNHDDDENAIKALNQGAQDYIVKGKFDRQLLTKTIKFAIERKKRAMELELSEERLELALFSSNIGTWDWNVKTDTFTCDRRWKKIYGYNDNEIEDIKSEFIINKTHPDDVTRIEEKFKNIRVGDEYLYICEYRIKHVSGIWRWCFSQGKVVGWDNDGKPNRVVGTFRDFTHEKEFQLKHDAIRKMLSQKETNGSSNSNCIPICSHCKDIRVGDTEWLKPDEYFSRFFNIDFSHGVCEDCLKKYYPEAIQKPNNSQTEKR